MGRITLVALLLLTACSAQDPEAAREAKYRKDLAAATKQARAQLAYFWQHREAPEDDEYDFLLKVSFPPKDGTKEDEQLWVEDLGKSEDIISGNLSTTPAHQGETKKGDEVTFTEKQIVDWAFFQNEKLLGHYTTRVMLPRLPQDQAEAMSSMFGENPK
jgi:uncharacterized protein YegJ (DUF2314 family)